MKVITMYLPQFHRTAENDAWWGEGFTEWTAVRGAEKLWPGQYQPRVPLDRYYYSLLEKDTMAWQADLMEKYGVDGQCFYHYWFKDGRQVLEKPAQNLLRWKDVAMPFCFCWANESWARTWSRIADRNPWANTFEKDEPEQGTGILLEQKYGGEEQWRQHFRYLLTFFRDDRYIRVGGRPLFLIYKSAAVPCIGEMLEKWRAWAAESGLGGMYIVGANSSRKVEGCLDAVLHQEPQRTVSLMNDRRSGRKGLLRLDYDEVWRELLEFHHPNVHSAHGGFVGYDDTPRRGREGIVIDGATPDKFRGYLAELMAKNEAGNQEFTFLNAWNEWGEGMYLEPDERYRYAYLEAVPYAKEHYRTHIPKYERALSEQGDGQTEVWSARCSRYESYWRVLDAWLRLKEDGVSLDGYFAARGIRSVAVYGAGVLGRHLLRELEGGVTEVGAVIDRKSDALHIGRKVYSPEEDFPLVDGIIVTATYAFAEIKKQLAERGYRNILSLEEIVMEGM